jgi:hypothetical protein
MPNGLANQPDASMHIGRLAVWVKSGLFGTQQ